MLTKEHARKRLQWALDHADYTDKMWEKIVWSDECSVERGSGKDRLWVFRTPLEKWDRDHIQTYRKGKDIRIMVWAAIWGKERSRLIIMDRDFESKKHRYTSTSYIKVLGEALPEFWEEDMTFMQDNAPIHNAHVTRAWFKEEGVETMKNWPPYSPDLNPIEHLWFHLKKMVYELRPDIEGLAGSEEAIRAGFEEALIEAWELIPDQIIYNIAMSMKDRVKAVIAAEGWHTKY